MCCVIVEQLCSIREDGCWDAMNEIRRGFDVTVCVKRLCGRVVCVDVSANVGVDVSAEVY